jgi:hypothetical protein
MDWRNNMTKNQIIAKLKSEYPTLTKGVNDQIIVLDEVEYAETIARWADAELEKVAKEAEAQSKIQAKTELLERLGITEDEAKLLLA